MEKKKTKLLSKAFNAEYGLKYEGKLLKNWCARHIGNNEYEVRRADHSIINISIGQVVSGIGEVSLDDNGNMKVGGYTILKGHNIAHNMTAKKTRGKDQYMLSREGFKKIRIKVGENISGLGVVHGIDDYQNLKIGNMGVPVEQKIKELKILVFNEKNEKFPDYYNATFSLIEPGKETNYTDGVPGIFMPANGKKPAQFCEVSEDLGVLTTAVFWPSKNKKFSVGRVRTMEEAKIEKVIFEKVNEFKNEAKEFGINPEHHQELVNAKSALAEVNNEWTSYQFSASNNIEVFGLESGFKREYSSGPSY